MGDLKKSSLCDFGGNQAKTYKVKGKNANPNFEFLLVSKKATTLNINQIPIFALRL